METAFREEVVVPPQSLPKEIGPSQDDKDRSAMRSAETVLKLVPTCRSFIGAKIDPHSRTPVVAGRRPARPIC